MTFWETIERGEYVMFALAVIVIASVIILWVRCAKLSRHGKTTKKMMQRVRDYIMEGDLENAQHLSETTSTSGAKIVSKGLSRMGSSMAEVKEDVLSTAEKEKEEMGRGMRWLRTFAVVSPLLGLGGTLVGMIDRLRDLGTMGPQVDTASVCGALAPTIVTTVAGLGVGIVALVFMAILEGSMARAKRKLDEVGNEFIELLNEPS